ncbi:MAG: PAS domain S-box protein [Phenylobacterium sp.]|uniref:hybrid sensor histidine kinase/response regulator n=1 Tax=Phenylobacterium sp. TaxID=1871053 RepID=UPI001B77191D|nr:PAS domain-containing sensor histidine kinase [Phenylobacterium sp.]MBP7649201.1 PAS domain S-box protein [Phenylobacterium sp.]MBP7815367.1 PAS domain S-box protein [Phenylobacterium sp.]MBP9230895.1 PAS domain S-box protein [Phenylobacterium sp.]MBP9753713.1 PAS domain S-box protein [Phenylobacterium sp.]
MGSGQEAAPITDESRYRLLIDAITDYAIYMLDPDGRVTSWNPGAQRFKGYVASEIIGEHFSRFYSEDDRAAGIPAAALRAAREEGRFEKEGWRIRKDGSRFWAHVIIDPIRSPDGGLIGYAKITRDLTERKIAETALRASEEQFRLLVQGVTDYAIYMLDPTGKVSSWNAGAQRIKGYRPEEIVGSHFSRFYTEEDRASGLPDRALARAAAERRCEQEGWRVRKDGTRFWAHVVIDVIGDDAGGVIGFAKITRDITERRAAQQALETAREALLQSQKLEAIGQLTGGVAHDFNNLLMAVQGSLELVRKRLPHDPRVTPLIDNAMQGAQRGAALTQRMLAFARKQELRLGPVDLAALVRGMTGLLQRSLGPAMRIETHFPRGLALVLTDANQLENALLNLAVNARDAMPDGGAIRIEALPQTLTAKSEAGLPPGDYVCLSVSDTGHGMAPEVLARAAEPFFITKGVGKGTGLGLSMIHGLTEQSGGRMVLRSQVGEGATVELWLPQVRDGDERQVFVGTGAVEQIQPSGPLTVLAVDDDSLVLLNTVAMLEDLGHVVFPAISARDALATLKREQIDLVITDYAMPQVTGLQLADEIRASHPGVALILATGYAELPGGSDPHLTRLAKPFLQDDLARALQEAMARG